MSLALDILLLLFSAWAITHGIYLLRRKPVLPRTPYPHEIDWEAFDRAIEEALRDDPEADLTLEQIEQQMREREAQEESVRRLREHVEQNMAWAKTKPHLILPPTDECDHGNSHVFSSLGGTRVICADCSRQFCRKCEQWHGMKYHC